jgi:hypothetical protein
MEIEFGTILSIVGFYLSLISILGSLFFVHLGNWFKDISTTEQKWKRYKYMKQLDKDIECYLEAYDEKSPIPGVGFLLLTAFMVTLGLFALQLRASITSGDALANYLYLPMLLFFGAYAIGSLVYLVLGYRKVTLLYRDIDHKLSAGS